MKSFIISLLVLFSANVIAETRCLPTDTGKSECQVPVLMYHRVTSDLPPSDTVVSPWTLANHLDMIRQLGYTTITVSELARFMDGKISLPENSVAITFDDGWKDNMIAARMLVERKMSATFYVLSGAFNHHMYLSKDEVIWLSQYRNFEIGAHSHTHFMEWVGRMDTVDDRIMIGEIVMSKVILEDLIGKPVNSFAWPFGYSRQNVLKKMLAIGFTSTVHVNSESRNTVGDDVIKISRINVDGNCNADHLRQMLEKASLIECK